jgi:peptide/nickel transport system permease protein
LSISFDREELQLRLKILSKDPLSVAGSVIAIFFVGTALAVTLLGNRVVPYDPNRLAMSATFLSPSLEHLMGTDNLGRDIFSRVIVATPIDAEMAFLIVGVSICLGTSIGSFSGFFGGRIDELLMRVTDLFLAIPTLVMAVAVALALGPGVDHVIEANVVTWWPIYARLARAGSLSLRNSEFVESAKVSGLSQLSIIRKHIIPNNISPILVFGTLDLGNAILYASVLSYLGLGAQPPQAEWGRMVFDGQLFLTSAWWISLMPGAAIFVVALGFNLIGDVLRDVLDPRYRR